MKLNDYMGKNIFQPPGIKNTSIDLTSQIRNHMAKGELPDGKAIAMP